MLLCKGQPLGFQQQLFEEVAVIQGGVRDGAKLCFGGIHGGSYLRGVDAALYPLGEERHGLGGLDDVHLEAALPDEELTPLAGSRWGFGFFARERYGMVISGYRRCAHFSAFYPSRFSALFFRVRPAVTGLRTSHINARFICPLTAHFISGGLIP